MTLYLNGTTGVSGVDGSAGTPSLQGNDTNTGIVFGTDTVGVVTGGVQRTTVDSSGRLLVGTTSAAGGQVESKTATLASGDSAYAKKAFIANIPIGIVNTTGSLLAGFDSSIHGVDLGYVFNGTGYNLTFGTNSTTTGSPTERMRITSAGALKLSTSGSYRDATGTASEMLQSNNNNVLELRQTSATYANDMLQLRSVRNTTNNTYSAIGYFNETAGAYRFFVWDSGNVQNTNNSYGAISDIKLKENIVDATSQWNDIKTLQVRKYNFKQETGQSTHTQIGLVAQEVELVSPGLVSESPDRDSEGNDLGTVTKSVNYSVLYMKAVKALQEAMERIEQLETRISNLEVTP